MRGNLGGSEARGAEKATALVHGKLGDAVAVITVEVDLALKV